MRQKRRVLGMSVLGLGAALALAGCGAGQITQTDTQLPAVNGAFADLGKIHVRDAFVVYPGDARHYPAGADAPLSMVIVNNGTADDELLSVTAAGGQPAQVQGQKFIVSGGKLTISPKAGQSHEPGAAEQTSTPPPPSGAPSGQQPGGSAANAPSGGAPSDSGQPSGSASNAPSGSQPPSAPAAPPAPEQEHPVGHGTVDIPKLGAALYPGQTLKLTLTFRDAGSVTFDVPIGTAPTPPPAEEHGDGHSEGGHNEQPPAGSPEAHGDGH